MKHAIRARDRCYLEIIAGIDRDAVKRVGHVGAANVGQQFVRALGGQFAFAELFHAAAVRVNVGNQTSGLSE